MNSSPQVQRDERKAAVQDLETALADMKSDLRQMKWMAAVALAGVWSLVLKAYF